MINKILDREGHTHVVFVLGGITEKSIEYNKPAYMCFIDLEKTFDRIHVKI